MPARTPGGEGIAEPKQTYRFFNPLEPAAPEAGRKLAPGRPEDADRTPRVAVVVAHGMGQQVPFETLDLVVKGLLHKAKWRRPDGGEDRAPAAEWRELGVGQTRVGEATARFVRMEAKSPQGRREVDLYETYWAPLTEGRVGIRDVLGFLLRGGANGARNGATTFTRRLFGQDAEIAVPAGTTALLLAAAAFIVSLVAMNAVAGLVLVGAGWPPSALASEWTAGLVAFLAIVIPVVVAILVARRRRREVLDHERDAAHERARSARPRLRVIQAVGMRAFGWTIGAGIGLLLGGGALAVAYAASGGAPPDPLQRVGAGGVLLLLIAAGWEVGRWLAVPPPPEDARRESDRKGTEGEQDAGKDVRPLVVTAALAAFGALAVAGAFPRDAAGPRAVVLLGVGALGVLLVVLQSLGWRRREAQRRAARGAPKDEPRVDGAAFGPYAVLGVVALLAFSLLVAPLSDAAAERLRERPGGTSWLHAVAEAVADSDWRIRVLLGTTVGLLALAGTLLPPYARDVGARAPLGALAPLAGWHLLALALLAGVLVPLARGPETALPRVLVLVVWGLVAAIALGTRHFLVQFVGDVAAYVSPHRLDRFWELREQIKRRVRETVELVYDAREGDAFASDRVVVVGHSLGSVVAYDSLNALLREDKLVEETRDVGRRARTRDVRGRTRMLLTFGSPLDRTAFVFSSQGPRGSTTREQLAALTQPLIDDPATRKRLRWVNVWAPTDIISSGLKLYGDDAGKERVVENVEDPLASTPLASHNEYWHNEIVWRFLTRGVLDP